MAFYIHFIYRLKALLLRGVFQNLTHARWRCSREIIALYVAYCSEGITNYEYLYVPFDNPRNLTLPKRSKGFEGIC